jgi:hypothetical protein
LKGIANTKAQIQFQIRNSIPISLPHRALQLEVGSTELFQLPTISFVHCCIGVSLSLDDHHLSCSFQLFLSQNCLSLTYIRTKMSTVGAVYPSENPWSSFNKEAPYLSLAFPSQKDYGLWNSPLTKKTIASTRGESWGKLSTPVHSIPLLPTEEIPQEIIYPNDWEDDVSILNDNPDDDDIEILFLPRSTYDVLMPLFDELYIDDSNEEEGKEEEDDGCARAKAD